MPVDDPCLARPHAGALHGHRPDGDDAALLRLERALPALDHAGLAARRRARQPAHVRGARHAPAAARGQHGRNAVGRLPVRRRVPRCCGDDRCEDVPARDPVVGGPDPHRPLIAEAETRVDGPLSTQRLDARGRGARTGGGLAVPRARAAHAKPTGANGVRGDAEPALSPPPPFPGYLLIADRGNNRMLLIDGAKRILWQYPGPGGAQMPFQFDDDTFFGPHFDRIISNQEDQDTIQIITFPGGRPIWAYGHLNEAGSQPGYLHTPDDAYVLPNGLRSVADAYNCRVIFL